MFSQDGTTDPSLQWPAGLMANVDPNFGNDSFFPNSFPQNDYMNLGYLGNESFSPLSQTLSHAESASIPADYETPNSCAELAEEPVVVKLRPGRKRKCDVIDRDALRRDRVIRNRMAAQRSREKKRKESLSVESENEKLRKDNSQLEGRVQSLEDTNKILLQRLSEMAAQMNAMQSQLQSQQELSNQAISLLFNGFGEPAVLPVGVRLRSLSQQRKSLKMFGDRQLRMILTAKFAQLFILTWFAAHRFLVASLSRPGTPLNFFLSLLNKRQASSVSFPSASPYSSSFPSISYPFSNIRHEFDSTLPNDAYPKWFPPRSD